MRQDSLKGKETGTHQPHHVLFPNIWIISFYIILFSCLKPVSPKGNQPWIFTGKVKKWSHSVMSNSLRPHGLYPARLPCPWDFPGKNTGMGYHFFLQGTFPTPGSNLGLPNCRKALYCLSHQGIPGNSLGGLMLKLQLQLQYFGHLMQRANLLEKIWCWERLKAIGEGGDRGWDGQIVSSTQWTWVWANSQETVEDRGV